MTGIAISRPAANVGRIAISVILVGAGLVAGFGLAKVFATVDLNAGSASHQTISLSADPAYQAQRTGERSGLSGADGYQAQRAGERTGTEAVSGEAGYQAQRADERSTAPAPGLDLGASWQAQRSGERAP